MPKKRIIANLALINNQIVQSEQFKRYYPIGDPVIVVENLDRWGIDEIVLCDIKASQQNRLIDGDIVSKVSKAAFVPLCVGGGVSSLDDCRELLRAGADKILINTLLWEKPKIVQEAAETFGAQCIVASCDVIEKGGKWFVVDYSSGASLCPIEGLVVRLNGLDVGEVIVRSIRHDGSLAGAAHGLYAELAEALTIPMIVAGGIGCGRDALDVFTHSQAEAVAVGNMLHHKEHAVSVLKSFLMQQGIEMRLENGPSYIKFDYGQEGNLLKLSDEDLLSQYFHYVEPEVV